MAEQLRVLQVEDCESDAALVVRLLEKAGYQVRSQRVETAVEMWEALSGQEWDVIIADYRLPQFDAPGALRILHESGRDIPFIVVSGTIGEDLAVQMMKCGTHDYLMKSSLPRLAPAVEREIREARARRERRQAEEALRESEERLALAVNATQLGTFDYYPQTGKLIWSGFAKSHFGLSPDAEPSYDLFLRALHPEDRDRVEATIRSALRREHGGQYSDEYRTIGLQDGTERWLSARGHVFFDQEHRPVRFIGVSLDITEPKQMEEALRLSEERFAKAFRMSPVGATLVRLADKTITEVNAAHLSMIGYEREEVVGKRPDEVDLFPNPNTVDELKRRFQEQGKLEDVEVQFRRKDGTNGYAMVSAEILRIGHETYVLGVFNDITERKLAEEKLAFHALHDPLTGLANRNLFMEHLERMFYHAKRYPEARLSVLFLDLDRFKVVNDSLGHIAGDEVLTTVAARIKRVLRQSDVVARLGGDEFLIALDELPGLHEAEEISRRILAEIRKPVTLSGHDHVVTGSIGIAPGSVDYASPKELVRDADIAMYRAKESGRDRYTVFDASMRKDMLALLDVEAGLRRAIEREEFELYYQEIYSLDGQAPVGFEALLRWRRPSGLQAPSAFLQVAEDAGLMNEIGWWVLENACRQVGQETAGDHRYLSINVSGAQFSDAQLLSRVQRALAESDLDPSRLALEITETVIMENPTITARRIRDLKELGVGVHIDDFGTGFSSLSRLLHLPITALKIDRSFVGAITDENGAAGIVSAVVSMGHSLGLRVVAEGIETEAQLGYLRRIGCDFGQGHFFSPARPALELFQCAASGRQ
jgi:diguanylate cyclase (GGDEF)-like protein/PAS domain S-box-containing protein